MKITTVIPRFTRLLWQPKNRVNRKSRYTSHSIEEKIVKKKNFYYTEILYYKMSLYKFIQTRSKNRVIENRVMENRVKRGITVHRSGGVGQAGPIRLSFSL